MDLTNLQKLINDSGMSPDSISDASGVNVQTIKKYYHTNDGNPQADFLLKLSDFFAVPLDYLCGRCTKEECAAVEESFADNFRLLRKETYEAYTLKFRTSANTPKGYCAPYPYNLLDDLFGEPFDHVISEDEMNGLTAALSSLSEREQEVLHMYYEEEKTLEEIGKVFGVGRERIRQIVAKGLRKLRHPSRSRQIRYGDEGSKWRKELIEKEYELEQRECALEQAEANFRLKVDEINKRLDQIKEAYAEAQENKKEAYAEAHKEEIDSDVIHQWAMYDAAPEQYGCSIAFSDLDLSVRSQNCLLRSGTNTVDKIIAKIKTPDKYHYHDSSLVHVRNIGQKSYMEIIEKVEKLTGTDLSDYYQGYDIFDGKGKLIKGGAA